MRWPWAKKPAPRVRQNIGPDRGSLYIFASVRSVEQSAKPDCLWVVLDMGDGRLRLETPRSEADRFPVGEKIRLRVEPIP